MTQDNDETDPQQPSLEVAFNGANLQEVAKSLVAIAKNHTKEQPAVQSILSSLDRLADVNPVAALRVILPVYRTLYKQDPALPDAAMVEKWSAIADRAGAENPLTTLVNIDETLAALSGIAEQSSPDQQRANSAMIYEGFKKIVKLAIPAAANTGAIVFEDKGEVTPKIPFILSLLEKVALALPATDPLAQAAIDEFHDVVVTKYAQIDPFTATAFAEMGDEIMHDFAPDSPLLPKVRAAFETLKRQIHAPGNGGNALQP
jgi:hypothetical protein